MSVRRFLFGSSVTKDQAGGWEGVGPPGRNAGAVQAGKETMGNHWGACGGNAELPAAAVDSTAEPKGAILQRKHSAVKIAADCFSLSNPNTGRMRLIPGRIFFPVCLSHGIMSQRRLSKRNIRRVFKPNAGGQERRR